jgi:hypothetical protein
VGPMLDKNKSWKGHVQTAELVDIDTRSEEMPEKSLPVLTLECSFQKVPFTLAQIAKITALKNYSHI